MEWQIHMQWATKWAHVCELAQPILKATLGEMDAPLRLEVAGLDIIEVEIEEDDDGNERILILRSNHSG